MIDLHNHILPGIDDGPRDIEEAVAMAKMAVEIGTTVMAVTPHRYWPGRDAPADWIAWQRIRLQRILDDREIPLTLVDGTEIPMHPSVAGLLAENRLARLGGVDGSYALIEPPFERLPHLGTTIIRSIMSAGIIPILAHPERNAEIQAAQASHPFLETCGALGVVMQITSGSIMGIFGPYAEINARRIVCREDWEVIIASDAHSASDRAPDLLRKAADRVAEWTGDADRANAMVDDLPRSYLPASALERRANDLSETPPDAMLAI